MTAQEHYEALDAIVSLISRVRLDADMHDLMDYEDGDPVYDALNLAEALLRERTDERIKAGR